MQPKRTIEYLFDIYTKSLSCHRYINQQDVVEVATIVKRLMVVLHNRLTQEKDF